MNWIVNFYDEDVMKDIQNWLVGIKAKFTWIVELIEEYGPKETGMPYVKALGSSLFEMRAKGKEGIGRAIFCILSEKRIVILTGFIKKTQKTPRSEMELSIRRMREVKQDE